MNVDNQIWKFNKEFVEWGLRDETCEYLTLDDAKHLFVLLDDILPTHKCGGF